MIKIFLNSLLMCRINKKQIGWVVGCAHISIFLVFFLICFAFAGSGSIYINNDGKHNYKAVRLTEKIYNNCNPNLSDILIVDEHGNDVPYFINSFELNKLEVSKQIYSLSLLNSFFKNNDSFADYFIETSEGSDIIATVISVETQAPLFAKNIELSGSYDGLHWDFIQTDKLFRVDGNEKLSINFNTPLKYTHYRFKVIDNIENVTFENVLLSYNHSTVNESLFIEEMLLDFETEEVDNKTIVTLLGLKNIKLKDIIIETDNQFKRQVFYSSDRSKTLFNLSFEKEIYKDTTIPVNEHNIDNDYIKLQIENKNDAPIQIKSINCSYYVDEIIFKGQPGMSYNLFFGDKSILTPPIYDIANYKNLILIEGYDILTIEDIKVYIDKAPKYKDYDYTILFNIIIVLIAVFLGFILLMRLKRTHS